jgi:hypothetical protein
MPEPSVDELTARALQKHEDETARAQREQEERDAAFARSLDMQLNLGPGDAPRRDASGSSAVNMPGAW